MNKRRRFKAKRRRAVSHLRFRGDAFALLFKPPDVRRYPSVVSSWPVRFDILYGAGVLMPMRFDSSYVNSA